MTVKASPTPANGVINNKTRWAERRGWLGYLGTALPCGPQGQTGPQRGEIWRDAPGIWDSTSVLWVSLSEGRRRILGAPPLPLESEFYQRDQTCRAHRVAEQHGTHWRWSALIGRSTGVIHPAKSVLLFHIGRGEPAHLRSNKKDKRTNVSWATCIFVMLLFVRCVNYWIISSLSPQWPSVSHCLKLHWKGLMQPTFLTILPFPRKIRTPTMQVPHLTKDVFHYWLSIKELS